MITLVAVALAGLAAALLAGGRPNVLKARLTPASRTALPRCCQDLAPRFHVAATATSWKLGARKSPHSGSLVQAGCRNCPRLLPLRGKRHRWRGALSTRLRGRSPASRREADVVEACVALGAELQVGVPVTRALAAVAEDWPELFKPGAAAAAVGGDVAGALRATAATPGAGSLRAVAAGWDVTDRTGAALSRTVIAVADALRAETAVRREAHSQLATARATARLLAVLPFGTLLLLSGGDGAALSFLVSTPIGLGCLIGALLFVAAGLWWVDRLARSATRSVWER